MWPEAEAAVVLARGDEASTMTNLAWAGLVPGRAMACCQRPERSGARAARQDSMRDSAEGGVEGWSWVAGQARRLMTEVMAEKIRAIQQIKMKYSCCF
jgi:hypothetical protein